MSNLIRKAPASLAPATTLRDVVRNCDPEVPLGGNDPRWEDFSLARGDHAADALGKELRYRVEGQFVHAAFVSHRGAGKSTEILRLTERLRDAYETIYIAATIEMDPLRIEAEDLLFNLAVAVEAHMRERGLPLPKSLLQRVRAWFEDVVSTTKWVQGFNAEAAAGVEGKVSSPFLGGVFGSLKALFKQESEYRTEVKEVLRKYPGTLLQSVNELLDAAGAILGDRGLLVVIDNLDRYEPAVIDKLLGAGADRIRQLHTSLILTPPIGLLLQPHSASLDQIYACQFLYAVTLRAKDQAYDLFTGPGRDLMEAALAKRIDLDAMIPDKAARDRLIGASGGAMRELLALVHQSVLVARGEVLTADDVERAVSQRKQRLRDLINANAWLETLARIGNEKQIYPDPKCLQVLHHRLAFRYNGEGWYDIHPLAAEIPEVDRARREYVR